MIEVPVWAAIVIGLVIAWLLAFAIISVWGTSILGRALHRERRRNRATSLSKRTPRVRRKPLTAGQRQRQAATAAVEDMARTKAALRGQEHQQWLTAWATISGIPSDYQLERYVRELAADAVLEPAAREQRKTTVRQHNRLHGHEQTVLNADGQVVTRHWDGLHHTTCPYECDCPDWARRSA